MADGTDRRPGTRPLLRECARCAQAAVRHHACAFLTGVFHPSNWRCVSLAALEWHAAVTYGDEVEVLVIERPNGAMVVLGRRVGEPQRIRTAQVITAKGQLAPLTLAVVEDIIGILGPTDEGGRRG